MSTFPEVKPITSFPVLSPGGGHQLTVSVCLCSQAEEAEATYRTCVADAVTHQQGLEHVKVTVLRQIQDLIKQTDQTLRAVSIPY